MLNVKYSFLQVIHDQIRRHSGFQIEDLYKLIYQITYGPSHLLEDKKNAGTKLKREWKELGKVLKNEPLLEMIDPLGELVRVNLRIYKKIGGKFENLLEKMMLSAQEFTIKPNKMQKYWKFILEMANHQEIPFSSKAVNQFWIQMKQRKFPLISHSETYIDASQPVYRIILKKYGEKMYQVENR